jgi:hypothetical protein
MRAMPRTLPLAVALLFAVMLAGCGINTDFDEINPSLVRDNIHDWVGRDNAKGEAISPSTFELTDEERRLRDLGYPLIEPPYLRHKVYSVFNEYGLNPDIQKQMANPAAYYDHMMDDKVRSPTSRYAQLTQDIRNDSERLPQFFSTASRVVDLDAKRNKSLAFIPGLTAAERTNTLNRIKENDRVIAQVRVSLSRRVANYRYALERLVIASPSQEAVTVEQALNRLHSDVSHYRVHLAPPYARGPSLAFQR